jgi:NTE family protein
MARYGGFDYDKSERLIAIGRQKTLQAISKL